MAKFRSEKFIKDLVIVADDGNLYYLKEDEWRNPKYRKEPSQFKPGLIYMIRQNVALGAIPEPEDAPTKQADNGALGFCYLLNMASLRIPGEFLNGLPETEEVDWLEDAKSAQKAS